MVIYSLFFLWTSHSSQTKLKVVSTQTFGLSLSLTQSWRLLSFVAGEASSALSEKFVRFSCRPFYTHQDKANEDFKISNSVVH